MTNTGGCSIVSSPTCTHRRTPAAVGSSVKVVAPSLRAKHRARHRLSSGAAPGGRYSRAEMPATSAHHDVEELEVAPSPFRVAIGRARIEALSGSGSAVEPHRESIAAERPEFEYRLVKRRGKRSAEEASWNELGRRGWELVGVTARHAAFKRRVSGGVSR
jgi:hypothetical protein